MLFFYFIFYFYKFTQFPTFMRRLELHLQELGAFTFLYDSPTGIFSNQIVFPRSINLYSAFVPLWNTKKVISEARSVGFSIYLMLTFPT
jgi:hypothetical protein